MNVVLQLSLASVIFFADPPATGSMRQVAGIRCERLSPSAAISLDAEDLDLQSFTRIISCVTGERFLFNTDLTASISILAPRKMSVREAQEAFLQVLDAVGLAPLKVGKFTRILPKSRAAARTRIASGATQGEWQTEFITVPKGREMEAQALAKLLISPADNVGFHLASSTLIITSTAERIRQLRALVLQSGRAQSAWSTFLSILPEHVSPAQVERLLRRAAVHLEVSVAIGLTAHGGQLFMAGARRDVLRLRRLLLRMLEMSPVAIEQFIIRVNNGDRSSISKILREVTNQ